MTPPLDPYVMRLVRTHDRGRFVTALLAPAPLRDGLMVAWKKG